MERLTSTLKPQSEKNRNKGRTAADYRLCYCLVGMNALTDRYRRGQRMEMSREDIYRCSRVDFADRRRVAHTGRERSSCVPVEFRIRR